MNLKWPLQGSPRKSWKASTSRSRPNCVVKFCSTDLFVLGSGKLPLILNAFLGGCLRRLVTYNCFPTLCRGPQKLASCPQPSPIEWWSSRPITIPRVLWKFMTPNWLLNAHCFAGFILPQAISPLVKPRSRAQRKQSHSFLINFNVPHRPSGKVMLMSFSWQGWRFWIFWNFRWRFTRCASYSWSATVGYEVTTTEEMAPNNLNFTLHREIYVGKMFGSSNLTLKIVFLFCNIFWFFDICKL